MMMAVGCLTAVAEGTSTPKDTDAQRTRFFCGAGYTLRTLGGLTVTAGATWRRHDVQWGYTHGLDKSDPVYWYNDDGIWLSTTRYRQCSINLRYGYHLPLAERLDLLPQIGCGLQLLAAQQVEGNDDYGHMAKASTLSAGFRLAYQITPYLLVFASPEYALPLSQDTYYKHTAQVSNYSAGGFSATAGLLFTF